MIKLLNNICKVAIIFLFFACWTYTREILQPVNIHWKERSDLEDGICQMLVSFMWPHPKIVQIVVLVASPTYFFLLEIFESHLFDWVIDSIIMFCFVLFYFVLHLSQYTSIVV